MVLRLKAAEQFHDDRLHRDVQGRGHLVADQQVGLDDQGTGDSDALALSAGQLVRIPGEEVTAERHIRQRPGSALRPLPVRQPQVLLQRLRNDLADGLAWIERRIGILEDVLHPPQDLPRPDTGTGRQRCALERDVAGPVAVQADDAAGERGLSRAGFADHGDA